MPSCRMIAYSKWSLSVVFIIAASGIDAVAQDSTSKAGCLPGDAVRPWDDAGAAFGTEQCNDYVVDLTPFAASWGTNFGIAPIIKSSKTAAGFQSSLISSQAISRRHLFGGALPNTIYEAWTGPGFGVNNSILISDPGSPVGTAAEFTNQFGVTFAEFSTTDFGASYNGVIGGLVHLFHANPSRLFVSRRVVATNSCDDNSNAAQMGIGTVDASGFVHFRADCFACTAGCGLTNLADDNIFQVNMATRDCDGLNVISNDFPGGLFDAPATRWLVRNAADPHNTPNIMPAAVTGGLPLYLGSNFLIQYLRGSTFGAITADMTHIPSAAIVDHRGNISYTSKNCAFLNSTHGVAAMLGHRVGPCEAGVCTDKIILWGLNGVGAVTGTMELTLPLHPMNVTDNDDGFLNLTDPSLPNEFNNYRSQVAFRGGNGTVAINVDPQGNLLVAAEVDHPFNGFVLGHANDWDLNYVAVARIDCTTGIESWTMAGYNVSDTAGGALDGKDIYSGAGGAGPIIGNMRPVIGDGTGGGPAVGVPMIDSAGNVWLISDIELLANPGVITRALLRSVYNPGAFSYRLELVLKLDDIFHGVNSDRDYQVNFIDLRDLNSISSGTAFSHNISEVAHMNSDPSLYSPADPRSLGGIVLAAGITYDSNQDSAFDDCTAVLGSTDEQYNVLLYIGATGQVPCVDDADCSDGVACTSDRCVANECVYADSIYGDVDGNGTVSLFDLFCILDGLADDFTDCSFSSVDIDPCPRGNGTINLGDLFAVLNAFSDVDPCCTPGTGGCCISGTCDTRTEIDCVSAGGIYQGDDSDCGVINCPATGACCRFGVCDELTQAICIGTGGVYQGDGVACTPATCPQGACCTLGVCTPDTAQATCTGGGGIYQGDASTCTPDPCAKGACCLAGFCGVDYAEGDCIAAGGVYQGDSTGCAPSPCGTPVDVVINEIRIDQPSTDDDEYFELTGAPGTPLDGLTYLVIGDGAGGSGTIEAVLDLTGNSIPLSGFFLVAETSPMPNLFATPDLVASVNFENGDNVTHMLVAGFTGSNGDDLDINDDCVLDATPWVAELDRVAMIEEFNPPAGTECHYGSGGQIVGPDGTFVPGHVYRCPDGSAGAWLIGPFAIPGLDTPGGANACIIGPAGFRTNDIPDLKKDDVIRGSR